MAKLTITPSQDLSSAADEESRQVGRPLFDGYCQVRAEEPVVEVVKLVKRKRRVQPDESDEALQSTILYRAKRGSR